jgi:hypothetical protein
MLAMMTNDEHRPTQINIYKTFIIFFIPVLVLWLLNWIIPIIFDWIAVEAYSKDNLARTGTFGDTFGAVNALFSGLAFAGVAVAVVFQWKELQHLEEQTAIVKRQSREAEDERKKAERYASLTASLNAATSLTQAFSRSIEFTMAYGEKSSTLSEGKAVQTGKSRNVIAESMFRKYKQIQEMILF